MPFLTIVLFGFATHALTVFIEIVVEAVTEATTCFDGQDAYHKLMWKHFIFKLDQTYSSTYAWYMGQSANILPYRDLYLNRSFVTRSKTRKNQGALDGTGGREEIAHMWQSQGRVRTRLRAKRVAFITMYQRDWQRSKVQTECTSPLASLCSSKTQKN